MDKVGKDRVKSGSKALYAVCTMDNVARIVSSHDCHHDTKVKPEAATAVIELLMMGGKTPETR
jgi:(2Fe-2S) ferredoxin